MYVIRGVPGSLVGKATVFEPVRAILGLAGVLTGATLLVANASAIATDLGVPQVIIGFTLVALGTSLPELVTTIQAQRRGESDLVVGNLFGSNLFNSLAGGAIVGFAAVVGVSFGALQAVPAAMSQRIAARRLVLHSGAPATEKQAIQTLLKTLAK